jgi:hypothetical protein
MPESSECRKRRTSILTIPKSASAMASSLQGEGEQRNRKWRRDKKAQGAE